MRTRPVLFAAAVAAAGLAALGTVAAQQPSPPTSGPKTGAPGAPGVLPATTVRPYSGAPPSGAPPAPPAGAGVGNKPRLTSPVMAGPDGVRPAGGFVLPPPRMDLPAFRPGGGGAPPAGQPLPPPGVQVETTGPKLTPVLSDPDPKPPVPAVPPPTGVAPVEPPLATVPAAPSPTAPVTPVPPAVGAGPSPLPPVSPTGPVTPDAPALPPATETAPPATTPVGPGAPAEPAAGPLATTTPAAPALPGRAATSVTVEAVCPETVAYGQEFQYKLIVRNTGTAGVPQVRVEDELPAGARYVGSDPAAELTGNRLVWAVGALDAGAEKHISVRVTPGEEGEVRSRATVMFAASVDARTRVTRPRLAAAVTGGETARVGEGATFQIKLTNSGSGPATGLMLQARLSDGLHHAQGQVIEAELPSLPPGETRSVPLKVGAAKPGVQWCQIVVSAAGSPDAGAKASVTVVEPMLVVKQTGPAKCLVRAEPSYTIELANPGTAATDPVQLHTVLPAGFEFLQASDGGAATGTTVSWRLPSLPAGGSRAVTLKLRATADTNGEVALRTIAHAGAPAVAPAGGAAAAAAPRPTGRGLEAAAETMVSAEGVAAIRFEVRGLDNPVEVGKEATYEIRVMNQGTGPCANVRLAAALSEGTEFVAATGGTDQAAGVKAQGLQLAFEPIPTLGVKGEVVYRVKVRGSVPGDLRFRVQLTSDQLTTPVIKEESTRFYKQ